MKTLNNALFLCRTDFFLNLVKPALIRLFFLDKLKVTGTQAFEEDWIIGCFCRFREKRIKADFEIGLPNLEKIEPTLNAQQLLTSLVGMESSSDCKASRRNCHGNPKPTQYIAPLCAVPKSRERPAHRSKARVR
jgi:hypothetical protein